MGRRLSSTTTSNRKKPDYYVADFETTTDMGQGFTEVWAAALVKLYTEDVTIDTSIDDFFERLFTLGDCIVYFHNLAFDGSFIMDHLLRQENFSQAITNVGTFEEPTYVRVSKKEMLKGQFTYSISEKNQWYTMTIKTEEGHTIEIRDSLKLLPFSVEKIGKSFGTKHKKLSMKYGGYRYAGMSISDKERKYIANDVLVVKEAIEIMFQQGHTKLTIGSCCLSEFRSGFLRTEYAKLFPNMYEINLHKDRFGAENAGRYILKAYAGGWCYLVPGKANKIIRNGSTADVNSLYPSMMHSESGNEYPVGYPTFWTGNMIPEEAKRGYYYIRFRCHFYLKKGYLPFVHIRGNYLYRANENLVSSDYHDIKTGKYHRYVLGLNGEKIDTIATMTMTMTDHELFLKHYNVTDYEILDGCYFQKMGGLFDDYLNKYKLIKMNSTGAIRETAKLYQNNLYGKMAASDDSSFKVARMGEDGVVKFIPQDESDKKPGYIPIGAAITSYARRFTITAAQQNYHGDDKPGFIYADTDSIHCDLPAEEIKGITVHPTNYNCWKLEASWDEAIFVRQKTYIEHVVAENLDPVDKPYYNIKCAGMGKTPKRLFNVSLTGIKIGDSREHPIEPRIKTNSDYEKASDITRDCIQFIIKKRTLADFKVGLTVPGNLKARRVRGGIFLRDQDYKMR